MRRHFAFWTAAAIIGTLGATSPLAAQFDAGMGATRHKVRIGFGGGVSVPTQDAGKVLKTGVNGQGFLLIDPGFIPPIRLNLGYQKFDFKEVLRGGLPGAPGIASGENQILSGVAGLSINLIQLGPIRPYVTAGVGAFNIKNDLTNTAGTTTSSSDTKFGIDGGGGLALKLGRLEAFIEGRVQNVYTDKGAIDTKTITSIPVTFGIIF